MSALAAARAVADAVLYEGYLLYPYRASAVKNRSRWQFGVLGPPAAAPSACAEPPSLSLQCLLASPVRPPAVTLHLRFLQVQARQLLDAARNPVPSLAPGSRTLVSWDEAVEHEITLSPWAATFDVDVPGGEDEERVDGGWIVRRREPLTALVRTTAEPDGDLLRLTVTVANTEPRVVTGKEEAARRSLVGAHLLLAARDGTFVSLIDPPPGAAAAAARCRQDRCWPVLAGPDDLLLGAPIILYDHPAVAAQSPGDLFDLTEIDEILTLRVMTMTDAEKAEARATDERARAIVDRCDNLEPGDLERLHGAWLDAPADSSLLIDGVPVAEGSLVRLRPSRRADAQDIFFAGQVARVTAVVSDVDDNTHVAVVLVDDPAADLHDWYGRYLYFAPGELEPLGEGT
ncbi:hypothetical protein JIG36_00130 [Actinoplanes sp. LDG1-06]|uniref:Uncharacterized protein n=1 Tax=Paractinoplanes ovalisporus TaxID=2810368 RepID=A0ABS2A283_9ACTN|nr:hypothetical protein [Actinoplanes ovalisporus]MBM2613961.1 hypothetical protein [Actinoplanes ovalisporus]